MVADRLLRACLAILLALMLQACGGDGSEPVLTESDAARSLASRVGRAAERAEMDPAVFTRRRTHAAESAAAIPTLTIELFDFAEAQFKTFFPSHQPDRQAGGMAYRFYPEVGTYLIVDEAARIYVLGGAFGQQVTYVGLISDYYPPKPPVCTSVQTGFDVTLLDQQPVLIDGGPGDGAEGPGDGAGAGSGEGAIRGADVSLYDHTGALLGTAVSDDKGLVRLKACGATGPFRIEFVGNDRAQYFDEGIAYTLFDSNDGPAWRPFPTGDRLTAVVENLTDHHVAVTLMTHVAAEDVRSQLSGASTARARASSVSAGNGRVGSMAAAMTASQVAAANDRARRIFNQKFTGAGISIDDVTRTPSLVYSLASLRSFGTDARGQYGQILNSLAKSAAQFNPSLSSPAREMTKQLTRDLTDGVIDDKDSAGEAVSPQAQRAYVAVQLSPSLTAQSAGRLTTEVSGQGTIVVTGSTAPAVTCGNGVGSCYPFGTVVALQAQAGAGTALQGWSEPCADTPESTSCLVTMSGDKVVKATFSASTPVPLRVTVAGTAAGSVTSQPTGISCPGDCSENFAPGTQVRLAAVAGSGAMFNGWSGDACQGSTSSTCTVTLSAARSVTATFGALPTSTLTVARAGFGSGTVTSAPSGVNCGSACTLELVSGVSVTLTATPASGSTFAGWSGACTGSTPSCTVRVSAATQVIASFGTAAAALSVAKGGTGDGRVTSSPAGIDCGADCDEAFSVGTSVTLTAAPAAGSTFVGWSGGCSGSGSTCVIPMTAANSVAAVFDAATSGSRSLTVVRSGAGVGVVSSTPAGINSCTDTCSASFAVGTAVTLVAASSSPGSTFAGWTGEDSCQGSTSPTCSVILSTDKTVTATFIATDTPARVNLSVQKSGNGSGVVTSSPSGINCGSVCGASYATGTTVTLAAAPTTGSTFSGWAGDACQGSTSPTCTVSLTMAKTVTALFDLSISNVSLSVQKAGSGTGTVTSSPSGINCGSVCSALYAPGTTVSLTAAPSGSSTFAGWSGDACQGSTQSTCTLSLTAARNVTAVFQAFTPQLNVLLSGTGSGTVTSSPAGISCGSACSATFAAGTTVTLTATPGVASTFAGWTGDACQGSTSPTCAVSLTATSTVVATFNTATPALSVQKAGNGSGTVTASPAGIICGSVCSAFYAAGTTVTLTATANSGSTFAGWSGDACQGSTSATCAVGMTAARTVVAMFTSSEAEITLTSGTVVATAAVESFVFDFKIVDGRAVRVTGEVTIIGFDPSTDRLVFRDVQGGAPMTKAQFLALPGVSVAQNPFQNNTSIYLDPDSSVAGGITLAGILDDSLNSINIEIRAEAPS